MEVVKQLILNFAILLIFFYVFQTRHDYQAFKGIHMDKVFFYFLFAVIISQLLSLTTNGSGVRYDLRGIPMIIGGLYLGYRYNLFLFIGTTFIRSFFGINLGFWVSLIIYAAQTVVVMICYKKFRTAPYKKKLLFGFGISALSSLEFMATLAYLRNTLSYLEWAIYIAISAIGTSIIISNIENWRRNNFLQKKIIQSEKLEAISQLSAAISHEVRNPLTAVQGFLQLLKSDSYDLAKRNEFYDIALSEAKRAEKIIQDYLTFAKPSIQKIERMNLQNELTQAINIVHPLASMYSIQWNISLEESTYIIGDPHQFKQSIVNILKNSIEAMPDGGVLSVHCYREIHSVHLRISDTGIGMTTEQIHRLGEPYYSTKGIKGTGLGMMVSFGIFRSLKGIVHVESEVGKGTKFLITFPNKDKLVVIKK